MKKKRPSGNGIQSTEKQDPSSNPSRIKIWIRRVWQAVTAISFFLLLYLGLNNYVAEKISSWIEKRTVVVSAEWIFGKESGLSIASSPHEIELEPSKTLHIIRYLLTAKMIESFLTEEIAEVLEIDISRIRLVIDRLSESSDHYTPIFDRLILLPIDIKITNNENNQVLINKIELSHYAIANEPDAEEQSHIFMSASRDVAIEVPPNSMRSIGTSLPDQFSVELGFLAAPITSGIMSTEKHPTDHDRIFQIWKATESGLHFDKTAIKITAYDSRGRSFSYELDAIPLFDHLSEIFGDQFDEDERLHYMNLIIDRIEN